MSRAHDSFGGLLHAGSYLILIYIYYTALLCDTSRTFMSTR